MLHGLTRSFLHSFLTLNKVQANEMREKNNKEPKADEESWTPGKDKGGMKGSWILCGTKTGDKCQVVSCWGIINNVTTGPFSIFIQTNMIVKAYTNDSFPIRKISSLPYLCINLGSGWKFESIKWTTWKMLNLQLNH